MKTPHSKRGRPKTDTRPARCCACCSRWRPDTRDPIEGDCFFRQMASGFHACPHFKAASPEIVGQRHMALRHIGLVLRGEEAKDEI